MTTDHDDYQQTLRDIAAMERHWQQTGRATASEMIWHEQAKRWVKAYEREVRNVPVHE